MSTLLKPTKSAQALYAKFLVRERTRAGLTQAELAAHPSVIVSSQTIGHIENCRRPPTIRLSKAFDVAMDLDGILEALYLAYEREAGVPSDFWEYAELELVSSKIRMYSNFLIPGLVQTPDCIRAVVRSGLLADEVEERVSTRLGRQEVLRRSDPPEVFVFIDEFALRRTVGDSSVRDAQLRYLLKLMDEPRVHIRIVPDGVETFPSGSFTVLSFSDGSPDIAYVDAAEGLGRIVEPGVKVNSLALGFERIGSDALPAADSARMIRAVMETR